MSTRTSRFRLGTAVALAFGGGVLFASSMDFTRYSWAQDQPTTAQATALRGPNAPEGAGSFAAIAERATPAVVSIRTVQKARRQPNRMRGRAPQGMEEFLKQFGEQPPREARGEGSGFVVTSDGYIITNNHVVADADEVKVVLSDQREFRARVVGTDSTTDVAVVKIEAKDLSTLPIGNDEASRIGDWVLAVGNPLGLDFTVTAGIISAKARGGREVQLPGSAGLHITDFIQTDAAINPGNSGGPLLNLKGEVIGLNSAIASETGFYSGYGFAIPISLVKQVSDALIKDGKVSLPVMGIGVDQVDAEDAGINGMAKITGVKVMAFNPPNQGPAKDAGIEVGDIILTIDGIAVDRVSALQRVVRAHKVGQVVPVEVVRYGSKKTFKVKLAPAEEVARVVSNTLPERDDDVPAATSSSKLGIGVEAITPQMAEQLLAPAGKGVRVAEVSTSGPSSGKLIAGTDVILEVLSPAPKRTIKSPSDLSAATASLKDGEYVMLLVSNGGATRAVTIRVGK